MRIHQLQHFALGDDVGRVGHDFHDAVRAGGRHDLEGARVHEVAHQHTGLVAEHLVGGVPAAALGRVVDHVVVQQGGGVDELDEGRGLQVLAAAVGLPARGRMGRQQHDQGPQALAAARNDVFGDLVDQRNGTFQAGADDRIDIGHVRAHQGANLI